MSAEHDLYLEKSRFGSLDGLRFIAIAAVLFHHSPIRPVLAEQHVIYGKGFLGVDFFFVISGFLITTLLMRERRRTGAISLKGFYWRRALRILPLYLLVITAVGSYHVLLKQEPGAGNLWPFYYLFLANFLVGDIPLLAPMWSLSVEEQYYLFWPLMLLALPRRAIIPVLLVLITLSVTAATGVLGSRAVETASLNIPIPPAVYGAILMGSCLAAILHTARGFASVRMFLAPRWVPFAYAALLVGLLLVLPENLQGLPNFMVHLIMTALIGSLVIREDSPANKFLRARPVVRIGVISYGIYLLHLIALDLATRLAAVVGAAPEGWVLNLLYVGFSIAMAEISFRYFESYFLALRHKPLGIVKRSSQVKEETP